MTMRLRLCISILLVLLRHLHGWCCGIEVTLGLPHGAFVAAHRSHLNNLIVLAPEITLAACRAHDPRRQDASNELVRPGLLVNLSGWNTAATRNLLDDPDGGVDDGVGDNAANETVGDGVGEGHDGEGDECRDGVTGVAPVNHRRGLAHHGADDDEGAASGPGWDGGEDRGEEDGDEEADARSDGGKTGFAAFGDSSTGFDKGSYRGEAEQGADCDAEG